MNRTVAPEDYQELGKTYYKQKQYQKAIEAFTNAIDASVIPTVTLYDYRAASYEKLADFSAAIKDGREAIRLNKRDVKGYLRTASALQKLNKLDTAVNIYKYGMKNVPVNDKDFKLMQQLHDKLSRKLSPAKAIDPFTVLPLELVEMILCYMPFKNMVNCLRVSRGWKNYLIKRPSLWTDLDLSGASRPVSRAFIRNAVRYSENAVTRLTVHRFPHTDMLRNIATACKSLRELEVLSLPFILASSLIEVAQCALNLRKLVVKTEISLDTITQILRRRPTLEHVEFASMMPSDGNPEWKGLFPNLHTLLLHGSFGVHSVHILHSLFSQSPALRSLSMANLDQVPIFPFGDPRRLFSENALTSLTLRHIRLESFPNLPSTLKRLLIHPSRQLRLPQSLGDDDYMMGSIRERSWTNALRAHLPYLQYLCLRNVSNLNFGFLEALLELYEDENGEMKRMDEGSGIPLQHLCLNGLLLDTTSGHLFSPQTPGRPGGLLTSPRIMSPSLTSLQLPELPCTDDDIEMLLAHTTSLQVLDLSSTQISGASIRMLVDGLPNLTHLNADNCRRVSSRDVVDYAMRKGVTVSCKMGDAPKGGKKLRYG